MLSQQRHCSIQLGLRDRIRTGQDDGGCGFNLVVVELTEVLHVNLHLTGIRHGDGVTQGNFLVHNFIYRADDIGQLADTGGFDQNAVGVVLLDDLFQSLAKVAYQRAANAAGVHFGNVDTSILQETAINADLTEFVFDQNQLLSAISFRNHLFNQRGFTGTQEAGINVNFGHNRFTSQN